MARCNWGVWSVVSFVLAASLGACGGETADPSTSEGPLSGGAGGGGASNSSSDADSPNAGGVAATETSATALRWQDCFCPTTGNSEVAAAWNAAALTCAFDLFGEFLEACDGYVPPLALPNVTECSFVIPERGLLTSYGTVQLTEIDRKVSVVVNCETALAPLGESNDDTGIGTWRYDSSTRIMTVAGQVCDMAAAGGVRLDLIWGQGLILC